MSRSDNIVLDSAIKDLDLASSFSTVPFSCLNSSAISIGFTLTGNPVGVLSVEVSNDALNWSLMPDSSVNVNGALNNVYSITQLTTRWIRLNYVATSGTGQLNAVLVFRGS